MAPLQRSLKIFGLTMLFGLMGSCSPQGEWTPILHPPHTLSIHLTSTSSFGKSGTLRTQKGWPESCRMASVDQEVHASLCVSCQHEQWLLLRCYPYAGQFSPEDQCVHTAEQIKCLMREPVFAFTLSLKRSQERVLAENYALWKATVREIWEGRLDAAQRQDLESLFKLIGFFVRSLSELDPKDLEDDDLKALSPSLSGDQQLLSLLRTSLGQLQQQRRWGKLSLSSLIQELKTSLHARGLSSELIEYLDALSLEGLEEPSKN